MIREPIDTAGRVPDVHTVAIASPMTGQADITVLTFEAFYDTSRDRIASALALTLRDRDLAGEAADEAMTRAYARWSTVSALDNPAGWAYRVGLNWGRSVVRRRLRPRRPVHERDGELLPIADPAVAAAIAKLDVDQRAVVVCRYFFDWSEAQIATALDIKPGTVKSRLHRALTQLETRLAHLAPGAER
jgi:RNA polymerase sigma factor (sigma-70 family)